MGDDQGPRTKIGIKARAVSELWQHWVWWPTKDGALARALGPGVGKSHSHRRHGLPVPGGRGIGTKPRRESLSLVYEMGTRNFCTQAQEGN